MSGATGVGILGMDFYVPQQYVAQEDLETYDDIAAGGWQSPRQLVS